MASNVIPYQAPSAPAVASWRGIQPGDFDSAIRMAQAIARSGMAPKSYIPDERDPEKRDKIITAAVFTAMQLGGEIGLSPMTAVRSIAVINGLPGLYGPAMLGVVEASGKLADIDEGVTGEGPARHGWCTVQRVGRKPRTFKFSMADAQRAGLAGKRGPWTEYPDRMLLARARTFALRDVFPDVLMGLAYSVEELRDIPPEGGHAIEHDAAPSAGTYDAAAASISARVDAATTTTAAPKAKAPLLVNLPDGWDPAQFPRTKAGLKEALEFLSAAVLDGAPQVVGMNNDLLDTIADKVPALAEEVANLRAAAAEAMAPAADDDDDDHDDFPGDVPAKPDEHASDP